MANNIAATLETHGTDDPAALKANLPITDSPAYWETLCSWLTSELKGVSASLERLEQNCSRLESHFHPLESITTRVASNEVRTITITLRTNGHTHAFEIAGPDSVTVTRNPAGRITTVAIRTPEAALVLHSCGPLPVPCAPSANAWGE